MGGVVKGLLNKQIAGHLKVSEITVKLHRANMMRKLHARSIADVVRAGHQLELP
jgi:FixJ family two-component response regulator